MFCSFIGTSLQALVKNLHPEADRAPGLRLCRLAVAQVNGPGPGSPIIGFSGFPEPLRRLFRTRPQVAPVPAVPDGSRVVP